MGSSFLDNVEYRWFDHLYSVSRCGLVLRNNTTVAPKQRKDGYYSVGRRRLLHRMVATCWVDKPAGANHVHHKTGDKSDNRADNLEWVTPKKHMAEYHPRKPYKMSEAAKQKLRLAKLGSKTSEETKQKQREASLRAGCKPP